MNEHIFATDARAAELKQALHDAVELSKYADKDALVARDHAIRANLALTDYLRSVEGGAA